MHFCVLFYYYIQAVVTEEIVGRKTKEKSIEGATNRKINVGKNLDTPLPAPIKQVLLARSGFAAFIGPREQIKEGKKLCKKKTYV